MKEFKMYDHVKIFSSGAKGIIVDIIEREKETFYCIEYDEEYSYLDKDMGIIYVKVKDIVKI